MNVVSWAGPSLTTGVNVLVVPGFTPPSAAQPFTNWVARNGISKAIVGRCQTRLLQAVVRGSIEPVSVDLCLRQHRLSEIGFLNGICGGGIPAPAGGVPRWALSVLLSSSISGTTA